MEGNIMRIGIPRERLTNETRVAATPKTVEQLLKLGFTVAVESGAGQLASFDDKAFVQAGAEIVEGNSVSQSAIILKVNALCAAYLTRTIAGRTKLDGEHRRLSRHC